MEYIRRIQIKKHMKTFFLSVVIALSFFTLHAQAPNPALIGYFHNWQDANAPYIQLDQVDARYNMIDVAFAVPIAPTTYKMEFVPDQVSSSTFISQIQTLHTQGRKVIISLGGATSSVKINTYTQRDTFVATMSAILSTYDFDGMDLDFEGSSVMLTGGTIAAPIDSSLIYLIGGVKQIMSNYYTAKNKHLILTMAPETAFVQGGQSAFAGIWGAYLPVIHGLRDSLDILHLQLYNSGTMLGIDGNIYAQSSADFIVSMCEAVIQGFTTAGGNFIGLPASKVAVGLPACSLAAGGGYTDTATVSAAIRYLKGIGPKPGTYTLANASGYPSFRGMMTWSINWDAVASCGGAYEYASMYEHLFGLPNAVTSIKENNFKVYPNPSNDKIIVQFPTSTVFPKEVKIMNALGQMMYVKTWVNSNNQIDVSHFPKGMYVIQIDNKTSKIVVE